MGPAVLALLLVTCLGHAAGLVAAVKLPGALAPVASGVQRHSYATVAATSTQPPDADGAYGYKVHVKLSEEQLPELGPSFKELDVEVMPETDARLRVKIAPTGVKRWEVPESIVPRPGPAADLASSHRSGNLLYAVHQPMDSPGNPFALTVTRKATGQPVFDTRGHRFVFKDQYIEMTTNVPKDSHLYGLGEVTLPTGLLLPRDGTILTLYNRDVPAVVRKANLYGSHPFYLQLDADGSAHGVLLLNSNGMDVQLNSTTVTYKAIGGLVDLYFFMGPTPEAVIRQYHEVIGAPALPPYWALGAHQGRWGYSDVGALEEVVANYSAAGLPLECLWVDIEYQGGKRFQTLTFDDVRFNVKKMRAFVDQLTASGQHWVPIHDAGIAKQRGYKAYDEGTKANVWIKDVRGKPYVGQVWPGETVYPDYLSSPNVTRWIKDQLQAFYDQVPFDGLWLDMNEASNFCSGSNCRADTEDKMRLFWLQADTPHNYDLTRFINPRTTCMMSCDDEVIDAHLAHPPYRIHNFYWDDKGEIRDAPLNFKVISPTAKHVDGTREYDAHNLYGTAMAMRNYDAFSEVLGKRPYMILRSTFPGAGRYTGHWTGDNGANWESFQESIASILAPNLHGISMVGADVCGFIDMAAYNGRMGDPPTDLLPDAEFRELCNRWTSAGAFYPFLRNHMTYFTRPHEPYRWPDVTAAAKKAYTLRYRLLTYLYSSQFITHSHGGTLARPLFFTDPSDLAARNATAQWMLGEALLVSPVLKYKTEQISPHFTAGAWYSAWDYRRLDVATGGPVRLRVPLGDIAVHYRGGSIVPLQQYAPVTRDVRLSPVTLVVALPGSPSTGSSAAGGPLPPYALEDTCAAAHGRNPGQLVSCGFLFMDGGADLQVTPQTSVQVWFTAVASPDGKSGSITSTVKANGGDAKGRLRLEAVHVLGAPADAAGQPSVRVSHASAPKVEYDAGVITLTGLNHILGDAPLSLSWQL